MQDSEDVEEPDNNDDYDNGVEDGLDTGGHWDEAIDQPQENANNDKNCDELNQRHE